jgi:hypothetical protein
MRMLRSVVTAGAAGLLLVSCTSAGLAPSATLTTLTPDAEQWFRLSWEAVPETDGTHVRLRGYVENTYGEPAGRVQLLAQAFDTSGNLVDQKIVSVPGAVPAFDRVYYEIPTLPPANRYRVTIWAYERRKFF